MSDMRLIDANALRNVFDAMHAIPGGTHIDQLILLGIKSFIDEAPTIDAVPVVHGRWVRDEADENWFACSICKGENGPWHKFAECTYKFCPWCGTKMDGGAES